jgi:flagellar motility protein MotE (MotC chaperone)
VDCESWEDRPERAGQKPGSRDKSTSYIHDTPAEPNHLGGRAGREGAPAMSQVNKSLTVLVVALFGIWGCAQGPSGSSKDADKIKALEAKCSRLEEDYRTVAVARDQSRKQAAEAEKERAQVEEQRAALQKEVDQLKLVVKERDRLRQELEVRTGQRDMLQARCDKLRNGLKSLMGEDDAMTGQAPPATSTTALNSGGGR